MIDPITDWRERTFKKIDITVKEGQKVLDIGCGDGGDVLIFNKLGANVIGIDIKPHQSWQVLKQNNLRFKLANSCDIPFKDGTFDIVFEKDMLHHAKNPQKALTEIKRVTKKGGQIIVIEANKYNPILYLHMTLIRKHQHLTKKCFKSLLESCFVSVKFKTIEAHVYPIRHYSVMRIIHYIEDFLEKIPIISNFLSYNIAVIKKNEY